MSGSSGAAHVLAVDDDPSVRQMIVDYLGDKRDAGSLPSPAGREIADVVARETIDLLGAGFRLPGEDACKSPAAARGFWVTDHHAHRLKTRRTAYGPWLGADDY